MNSKNDTSGQQRPDQPNRQSGSGALSQTGNPGGGGGRKENEGRTEEGNKPSSSVIGTTAGAGISSRSASGGIAVAEERDVNRGSPALDVSREDAYWRENHSRQQFARNRSYDEFAPAYRNGYEGYRDFGSKGSFDNNEAELRRRYESKKSDLKWEDARHASRAAWDRFGTPRQGSEKLDTYGNVRKT